jgi:hypothetical protein
MTNQYTRSSVSLAVEALEGRDLLSSSPGGTLQLLSQQNFDNTLAGSMPAGWSQWSNLGPFGVNGNQGEGGGPGLLSTAAAGQNVLAWYAPVQSGNLQVSADVLANALIPAGVLLRGNGLSTAQPSYYAATVERGTTVDLWRVTNGAATLLASVTSSSYLSGQWLRVTLIANGRDLVVGVQRLDTGAYLTAGGGWQKGAVGALTFHDGSNQAILSGGQAGLMRFPAYQGTVVFDNFAITPVTGGKASYQQSFSGVAAGALPANWLQWSSVAPVGVSTALSLSAQSSLVATGGTGQEDRAFMDATEPANVQVSAAVYLNSLDPAEVIARGANLSSTPSYYAVSVTRGMQVKLVRVNGGSATTLGSLDSHGYLSNVWVQVTLTADGNQLLAQVERLDTDQYLNSSGYWQSTPTVALSRTDSSKSALTGDGQVGLVKGSSAPGPIAFDNFSVSQVVAPPLSVKLGGVPAGSTVSRQTVVTARVTDASPITHVDFYLDGALQLSDPAAPYAWTLDPSKVEDGTHTVLAIAYDKAGNVGQAALSVVTHNTGNVGAAGIPQHLPNIRLADLAYSGTPLSPAMQQLLQNDVDLVVSNTSYLSSINATAPNTPQLIYTNVASLYQGLLTSWLGYAYSHGLDPEQAFYHVAQATPFSGSSSSSQPVNWFWGVYQGGATANFIDYTAAAHTWDSRSVVFGGVGTSIYIGYPYMFREINLNLLSGAGSGWSGVLEYPTAVDSHGNPTAWGTLKTLTNTTNGLSRSGQITFDPPTNWKPASLNGSPLSYYVRIRTVTPGRAPVANTILGMDYLSTHGANSGVIPAFDYAAAGGKDYLTAAEYAHRKPGDNAWFAYQGQDLTQSYGPMRPATDPSSAAFRAWVIQYSLSYLNGNPLAAGLFVDNSSGDLSLATMNTLETTATYSTDYGSLLNALSQAIAPRWVLANVSGGGTSADPTIQLNAGYFDEFAIRAMQNNFVQFDDLAGQIAQWQALKSPAPYAVLDSLPAGGAVGDPRTEMATLAEYYLLGDPTSTFLDLWGGYAPATDWSQHFFPALTYNVGKPLGTWSLLASGQDPANRSLAYQVYQRQYSNALVLYKPLSYGGGVTGTTADNTATYLRLNGVYRVLQANGSLGAPVTGVSLRNGEGAVLIPV